MLHHHKFDNEQVMLRFLLQSYRDQTISDEDMKTAFEKFIIAIVYKKKSNESHITG